MDKIEKAASYGLSFDGYWRLTDEAKSNLDRLLMRFNAEVATAPDGPGKDMWRKEFADLVQDPRNINPSYISRIDQYFSSEDQGTSNVQEVLVEEGAKYQEPKDATIGDGIALTSIAHPPGLIEKIADAIRSGKLRMP